MSHAVFIIPLTPVLAKPAFLQFSYLAANGIPIFPATKFVLNFKNFFTQLKSRKQLTDPLSTG